MNRKQPNQPLMRDVDGVVRFQENKIVSYLLGICRAKGIADMNTLALIGFDVEDQAQFAQLIGYSLSGFSELPYVTDEKYESVELKRKKLK